MKPIPHNYRSDFTLVEIFYKHDKETNEMVATEIPDTEIDFEFVYRAEDDRTFSAGRKHGTYFNCKPISNNSIEVYIPLSRCNLGTGPLVHFLQLHTPNGNFPEEVQNICVPASTGYILHKGPSATVSTAAASILGSEVFSRVFTIELHHDEMRDDTDRFYLADAAAALRTIQRYLSSDRDTTPILFNLLDVNTNEKSYGSAIVVNETVNDNLLIDGQVWLGQKRYGLQLTYNKASNSFELSSFHLPTGVTQTTGESLDYVMSQQAVTHELAQTREDFETGDANTLAAAKTHTNQQLTEHDASSTAHADIRELLATRVGLPTFNAQDYTLTFTTQNGATVVFDLPLETMGLDYDSATKEMIYTNADGSKRRISLTEFIDIYVGSVGSEIQISIDTGNVIRATLLNGAVSWEKLSVALQNTINNISNVAAAALAGLDNTVKLDGTQTITGRKVFTGQMAFVNGIAENKNMDFILGIKGFAEGGDVNWITINDLKSLLGINSAVQPDVFNVNTNPNGVSGWTLPLSGSATTINAAANAATIGNWDYNIVGVPEYLAAYLNSVGWVQSGSYPRIVLFVRFLHVTDANGGTEASPAYSEVHQLAFTYPSGETAPINGNPQKLTLRVGGSYYSCLKITGNVAVTYVKGGRCSIKVSGSIGHDSGNTGTCYFRMQPLFAAITMASNI